MLSDLKLNLPLDCQKEDDKMLNVPKKQNVYQDYVTAASKDAKKN